MAQGAIDGVKNTLGVGDNNTKKWKKHVIRENHDLVDLFVGHFL